MTGRVRHVLLLVPLALACAAEERPAAVCAGCHRAEAAGHGSTGMARALEPAERGGVLASHKQLRFVQGPYRYGIDREGARSIYRVTYGNEEFAVPIQWAFGLGAAGQTYLFQRNGVWHESRVSYYSETDSLDLTVGALPDMPRSLDEAIGHELSTNGALECFQCHATGAVVEGVLQTGQLTPGIQCDRCHDKTVEHVVGFFKKGASPVTPSSFKKATAEEMSEYCGQCHRTWATIASNGPHNITNVRFQPYRLANSKCYDATDPRLRCTVCHDPHNEHKQAASFYDSKCQACHSASDAKAGAKLCKTGKANCTGCHMPKIYIKDAHNRFTDHWIRVARDGEDPPH